MGTRVSYPGELKKRKRTGQPAYVFPNVLARDFTAAKPLEKLVTDIRICPLVSRRCIFLVFWMYLMVRLSPKPLVSHKTQHSHWMP